MQNWIPAYAGMSGKSVMLVALVGVVEDFFQLDVQALAERGMMALSRSEHGLRLFEGICLDPPVLGAGDEKPGMEGLQPRLQMWPLSRSLRRLVLRSFFIGDGRHRSVSRNDESACRKYFTLKLARGTKRKHLHRYASPDERERGIIHIVVSMPLTRS